MTALKVHSTIGCCGIDCGLCPRFHAKGISACPGCGGKDFYSKHPSCGFVTCCVIKKGYEVCSDCNDYPCKRFDSEKQGFDSFVTHRKVFANLDFIKLYGINIFVEQQKMRMEILADFIVRFDDNRSKSFFCIACTLLHLDNLIAIQSYMNTFESTTDLKTLNKALKDKLISIASSLGIDLKLNNKK